MHGLRIGSFFSGIGGLELGLEWSGLGETVFQVEWNAFCQSVLAARWPDAVRFGDITTINASDLPAADLWCGGFPCQDVSKAGAGAGLEGERSGLFYELARLLREARALGRAPRILVLENVAAILDRGLDDVLATLAACGYDAEWDCIPADAVGAPHERDRWFLVAYSNTDGDGCQPRRRIFQVRGEDQLEQVGGGVPGRGPRQLRLDVPGARRYETHPDADGEGPHGPQERLGRQPAPAGLGGEVPHADGERPERTWPEHEGSGWAEPARLRQALPDADRERRAQQPQPEHEEEEESSAYGSRGDGPRGDDGRTVGQFAAPVARLGGGAHGAASWLDGSWEDGIPRVATDFPGRRARIAACGNAVSPVVAAYIGHRIQQAWE